MKTVYLEVTALGLGMAVFTAIIGVSLLSNPPDWNQFDPPHPAQATPQHGTIVYTVSQSDLDELRQQAFINGYGLETQVTEHCFIKQTYGNDAMFGCFGTTPYSEQFNVCMRTAILNGFVTDEARNLCG